MGSAQRQIRVHGDLLLHPVHVPISPFLCPSPLLCALLPTSACISPVHAHTSPSTRAPPACLCSTGGLQRCQFLDTHLLDTQEAAHTNTALKEPSLPAWSFAAPAGYKGPQPVDNLLKGLEEGQFGTGKRSSVFEHSSLSLRRSPTPSKAQAQGDGRDRGAAAGLLLLSESWC